MWSKDSENKTEYAVHCLLYSLHFKPRLPLQTIYGQLKTADLAGVYDHDMWSGVGIQRSLHSFTFLQLN